MPPVALVNLEDQWLGWQSAWLMQHAVEVCRELQAKFVVEVIQAASSQWPELINVS